MNLKVQKRIAGNVAGVSPKRIKLDESNAEEIKEAITKQDIKGLIREGIIKVKSEKGVSRVRARKRQIQRSKGRQKGHGSRKGSVRARVPKKEAWMSKIRVQRLFLNELKEKNLLVSGAFRNLYLKAKGGFFRNKRHIKIYLEDHNLINKNVMNKETKPEVKELKVKVTDSIKTKKEQPKTKTIKKISKDNSKTEKTSSNKK